MNKRFGDGEDSGKVNGITVTAEVANPVVTGTRNGGDLLGKREAVVFVCRPPCRQQWSKFG